MAFIIEEELEIAAPSAVVWEVITDLASYGQWNPFVVSCRSTLMVGDPIHMRVKIFSWLAQPQREFVQDHLPGRRLCYGLDGGRLRAVISRRCHELEALDPGRTLYRSRFALSGWIAPVTRILLGSHLRRGFNSMTAGIGVRAEQVWRGRQAMEHA
ncbi:MAG: SRPBCC domain-containing protein [Candidatus Binatia bacterium]